MDRAAFLQSTAAGLAGASALVSLRGVAGAADMVGTVLRMTILQAHTPRALMGRLSGAFFAAAIAGNRVGDGETGGVAALAGPQVAVWTGGLACVAGTIAPISSHDAKSLHWTW